LYPSDVSDAEWEFWVPYFPHDFPTWTAVYQQAQRWIDAGVFETITHELRVIVRMIKDRASQPSGHLRWADDAIDTRKRCPSRF
jgi:transposase